MGGGVSQVVCGRWDRDGVRGADGRLFAFKGDSQWCGVTKVVALPHRDDP